MSKTPLRRHLEASGLTAEAFADAHGMSPWSVRHWARGDKLPSLNNQSALRDATEGVVTPEAWLAWSLADRGPAEQTVDAGSTTVACDRRQISQPGAGR